MIIGSCELMRVNVRIMSNILASLQKIRYKSCHFKRVGLPTPADIITVNRVNIRFAPWPVIRVILIKISEFEVLTARII